jgi:hypothetical protein
MSLFLCFILYCKITYKPISRSFMVVLIVVEVRWFFMVIHNHKGHDRFEIRSCICSTNHKNIQNINYHNNDQDLLSLICQSQLGNCAWLHSFSNNCLRLFHQNIRGAYQKKNEELICSLSPKSPHIHCLAGHRLKGSWIRLYIFYVQYYNIIISLQNSGSSPVKAEE